MLPVLEAVPNFSEGRDLDWLRELVGVIASTGVEVLDSSADPDHNRSVVTFLGDPAGVEAAAVAAARFAMERIDLRRHRGAHPRVGALDVLPFVPLHGLAISDAVKSAHRVGAALAELGLPVFFYGEASDPPGRRLGDLRRGGFEALAEAFPEGRVPDLPAGRSAAHPTAGVACVGARRLLLAWNVYVEGIELERVRALAREVRELGGGFASLRALALQLESNDRIQLSMNLEDLDRTSPFDVFRHVEQRVREWGGRVTGTEVIGMIPDPLVLPAATDRLLLLDSPPSRLLSTRLARHVAERAARHAEALLQAVRDEGEAVPTRVREAALRLSGSLTQPSSLDRDR
jgi:glutamate formiminotransferase